MARGDKKPEAFTEDKFPREKPPEREEPPNWLMVHLYVKQAQVGLDMTTKDAAIRDNIADNLKRALNALYPKPLE